MSNDEGMTKSKCAKKNIQLWRQPCRLHCADSAGDTPATTGHLSIRISFVMRASSFRFVAIVSAVWKPPLLYEDQTEAGHHWHRLAGSDARASAAREWRGRSLCLRGS